MSSHKNRKGYPQRVALYFLCFAYPPVLIFSKNVIGYLRSPTCLQKTIISISYLAASVKKPTA